MAAQKNTRGRVGRLGYPYHRFASREPGSNATAVGVADEKGADTLTSGWAGRVAEDFVRDRVKGCEDDGETGGRVGRACPGLAKRMFLSWYKTYDLATNMASIHFSPSFWLQENTCR